MPPLAVDAEPPAADQRATFPIGGAQEMKDCGQAIVGETEGVIGEIGIGVWMYLRNLVAVEVWRRRGGGGR